MAAHVLYNWLDDPCRRSLPSRPIDMAIEYSGGWRLVSSSEFEVFFRPYPRPLTADHPLSKKSRFRRFLDATPGPGPASQVATVRCAHQSTVNAVRVDVIRGTEMIQRRATAFGGAGDHDGGAAGATSCHRSAPGGGRGAVGPLSRVFI